MLDNRRRVNAGLGCGMLIAVFFIALTAFGLAYQAKPSYFIDIGTRNDQAFIVPGTFNTKEPPEDKRTDPAQPDFRWTKAESKIDLPGVGSQAVTVTLRMLVYPDDPNPGLSVLVNEKPLPQPLVLPPKGQFTEVSFNVPANLFPDGNLHLKLKSNVWRPKGDNRDLGVVLDWVKVEPLNHDFWALIRPPDDVYLPLVITAVLAALIFVSIGMPMLYALLLTVALIGGGTYWLTADRLSLTTLFAVDFLRSLFFIWVGVLVLAEFCPWLFKKLGVAMTRRESGWLAGLFLLSFLLLFAAMLHPQFWSSDIGLNVHGLQDVQAGKAVQARELPDGQLAPYPPAYYFALLPFTFLSGSSDSQLELLFKIASSLLQASGVYMVFYLSSLLRRPLTVVRDSDLQRRETLEAEWEVGTNWAGILAAALFVVGKYPFLIFSQGNHTNLFGAWALLLFVCVVAATLSYFRRPHPPLVATPAEAALVEVSQTVVVGSVSRSASTNPVQTPDLTPAPTITVSTVSFSQRWLAQASKPWREKWWPRIALVSHYVLPYLALLLVFLAHYGTFLFANAFIVCFMVVLAVFGAKVGRRAALYVLAVWLAALLSAFLLYYYNHVTLISNQVSRALGGAGSNKPRPPYDFGATMRVFYSESQRYFGFVILIGAVGGVGLWLAGRYLIPKSARLPLNPVSAALTALVVSGLLFAIFGPAIGQAESRYQLYIAPVIALTAGAFFGRIWRSGFAGVVLFGALFLFQLLDTIAFWLDRITYYFRPYS